MSEPIIYQFFREKMDKNADIGIKVISFEKARWVLSRFMIPKELRPIIIKEMINLKMLHRLDQRKLEIKWNDCKSLLDNTSKIYREVGMWG